MDNAKLMTPGELSERSGVAVSALHFYEREGWRDAGHLDYQAPIDGGTVTVSCRRYELIRVAGPA